MSLYESGMRLSLAMVLYSFFCSVSAQDAKHYIGEFYGGGVIFYVDHSGEHGLVCSLMDISTKTAWSNIKGKIGASAQSQWDGKSNSKEIIEQQGHVASAASICNDYVNADYGTGIFNDWYLPAIDELNMLYNAKYQVNRSLLVDGDPNTTPIIDYIEGLANSTWFYWSSTEDGECCAFYYSFSLGMSLGFHTPNGSHFSKKHEMRVRAIRMF